MLRVCQKIWKILCYLPVLWADEDWDRGYLLRLLRFKLCRMEKVFRSYGKHVGHLKQAGQIRRCILILDRLLDESYYEMALKGPFRHKWYLKAEYAHKGDMEYLTTQLRKHLLSWWD